MMIQRNVSPNNVKNKLGTKIPENKKSSYYPKFLKMYIKTIGPRAQV